MKRRATDVIRISVARDKIGVTMVILAVVLRMLATNDWKKELGRSLKTS